MAGSTFVLTFLFLTFSSFILILFKRKKIIFLSDALNVCVCSVTCVRVYKSALFLFMHIENTAGTIVCSGANRSLCIVQSHRHVLCRRTHRIVHTTYTNMCLAKSLY